jgi:hypothetical protein
MDIPRLVRRLSQNQALTAAELDFLSRASAVHIGGSSPGSPFASYSQPGFHVESVGPKQFRVRVEVERGGVLDVSRPNAFNEGGARQAITNVEEAELMVVTNAERRIVSVQRLTTGAEEASLALRYSGAIRWGGRVLVVAGVGLSAYRVAAAPEGERHIVAGEEIGGQIGGAIGTAAAVAGCIALGVATGGIGLFLCGLGGGIALGAGGSYLGGATAGLFDEPRLPTRPMTETESREAAEALQRARPICPSCHAISREWESRGEFGARSGTSLSADERERLRIWLQGETGR